MKVNILKGNVIYIEDAFPLAKDFVEAIENNTNTVIPKWDEWLEGHAENGTWVITHNKGWVKKINWDYYINYNRWPLKHVDKDYDEDHLNSYEIIKMIDEPYKEVLKVWAEITNNEVPDIITKNYTIKKYKTSETFGPHTDNDHNGGIHPHDWTALVYLNDDYEGGKLEFNDLGYSISPKAGSVVFFSTDEVHTGHTVTSGNKYFIFFYIHSKFKYSHAICESYTNVVSNLMAESQIDFSDLFPTVQT
jgi:hypothetical protein